MPFWKKSEDPWDQPVRRPKPRPAPEAGAGTGQEENTAQELREMFRELGKGAREFFGMEEKAPEQEVPPQMCPWCGKEMERGYLLSGQWIYWQGKRPTALSLRGHAADALVINTEGGTLGPVTEPSAAAHVKNGSGCGRHPTGSILGFLPAPRRRTRRPRNPI